ncbi:S-adenosylmethionine transporter [Entomophthora muscae]|uniref:S-adenosylmethionine transporter n=1 Tax=Entomophthora muscae TaxID=34485 RepID=A0ACC2TML2_9FUNG|nr:S-adenosylmethionine transporter [Entomophthora muscae]
MMAASCGEVVSLTTSGYLDTFKSACLARVPTEIIKQRLQTGQYTGYRQAVSTIFKFEGLWGFYRGYFTTVVREIPFACIQFPLYEYLKATFATRTTSQGKETIPGLAAICGSASGACAAFITTPFDVTKTRIMLSSRDGTGHQYKGFANTISRIAREEGKLALFKGAVPRVMWMSLGGAIFLGSYEVVVDLFT